MKVIEFFGMIKRLPLDHKFSWGVPNTTGFLFYKLGYPRYFISKEDAKTKLDLLHFVTLHNIEDYNMINAFAQYATVENVNYEERWF